MSKNRVRAAFADGRPAFIAYLTAGDPDAEASARYVKALARAGADVIELGVPYSDPVADGPTNLKAADRALKGGGSLKSVLALSKRLRADGVATPFVLFTYYNPIFRLADDAAFARQARESGIDAVLIVDLPPEEAGRLRAALEKEGVGTVFLASPTTTPERLARIDEYSTEFVYYVSRLGVTGARTELSESLAEELAALRKHVKQPIAVGFGISTPEQAAKVAGLAEGVIVGSALVRLIEEAPNGAERKLSELASALAKAIHTK